MRTHLRAIEPSGAACVHALLLRTIPVLEPDCVVAISMSSPEAFSNTSLSYPDYRDYRDGNRTFDGLTGAAFGSFGVNPKPAAAPKVTFGFYVAGNFFRVLGVQPTLGRAVIESEDQAIGRDARGGPRA